MAIWCRQAALGVPEPTREGAVGAAVIQERWSTMAVISREGDVCVCVCVCCACPLPGDQPGGPGRPQERDGDGAVAGIAARAQFQTWLRNEAEQGPWPTVLGPRSTDEALQLHQAPVGYHSGCWALIRGVLSVLLAPGCTRPAQKEIGQLSTIPPYRCT